MLVSEPYFLPYSFREYRQAVLDFELVDFAMTHLTAEPDKLYPRGM